MGQANFPETARLLPVETVTLPERLESYWPLDMFPRPRGLDWLLGTKIELTSAFLRHVKAFNEAKARPPAPEKTYGIYILKTESTSKDIFEDLKNFPLTDPEDFGYLISRQFHYPFMIAASGLWPRRPVFHLTMDEYSFTPLTNVCFMESITGNALFVNAHWKEQASKWCISCSWPRERTIGSLVGDRVFVRLA